jgi:hypothetical protein
MSDEVSDIVPFGKTFTYQHSTKCIHVTRYEPDKSETTLGPNDYMRVINGRRRFSKSGLAVDMFEDEMEEVILMHIPTVEPYWASAQLALPLVELVGIVLLGSDSDRKNFEHGAELIFRPGAIDPALSSEESDLVLDALWSGLRCGLFHKGFMQARKLLSLDVQVTGRKGAPLVAYNKDDPDEQIIEIGSAEFIKAVAQEIRTLIARLRTDDALREGSFLKLWQQRWGTYPP